MTLFSDWMCRLQGDWVWLKKIPVGRTIPAVNHNTRNLFSQVTSARKPTVAPPRACCW